MIALTPCRLSCRVQFDLQSPARHSFDSGDFTLCPQLARIRFALERMPQGPFPGDLKRILQQSCFVTGFCHARVVIFIVSEL